MKTKFLLFLLAASAVLVPAARADVLDSLNIDIRLGRRTPPPPPPVVVVVPDNGPRRTMEWERKSWRFRNENYLYYPGYDVYYRQSDRTWFYSERGQWRSSRNLPDYIRVDFNRSVTLSMATDRPYQYHTQVRTYYPQNYFVTRVRVRDDDHDGRDRDGDGRDRDKGRGDNNRRPGNDHDGRDSDGDGKDKDKDRR